MDGEKPVNSTGMKIFLCITFTAFVTKGCKDQVFESNTNKSVDSKEEKKEEREEANTVASSEPSRPSEDPSELPGYGLVCGFLDESKYNCKLLENNKKTKVDLTDCNPRWTSSDPTAAIFLLAESSPFHIIFQGQRTSSLIFEPAKKCKIAGLKRMVAKIQDVLDSPPPVEDEPKSRFDFNQPLTNMSLTAINADNRCLNIVRLGASTSWVARFNDCAEVLPLELSPVLAMPGASSLSMGVEPDKYCLSSGGVLAQASDQVSPALCAAGDAQTFRLVAKEGVDVFQVKTVNGLCVNNAGSFAVGGNEFALADCADRELTQLFKLVER